MTFTAKTPKIQQLADLFPKTIEQLETIFLAETCIYIDRANVLWWQMKLGRHIDPKRLYQLLRSFSSIKDIRRYFWTLTWDKDSEKNIAQMIATWYKVSTKPVKIMYHSLDMTSIDEKSPDILKGYITKWLLHHLEQDNICVFNKELKKLNAKWIYKIEEKKCNFDVEIGVDMILDYERLSLTAYILWSWDSDFTDIVKKLITEWKKVFIFSTTQRVSKELSESGAFIFDIQKIREFICRNKEMSSQLDKKLL
jgi:uncharacterized LabA/DUF88 family protein